MKTRRNKPQMSKFCINLKSNNLLIFIFNAIISVKLTLKTMFSEQNYDFRRFLGKVALEKGFFWLLLLVLPEVFAVVFCTFFS